MAEFIVEAFGTLHKDFLIEADSADAAKEAVENAFKEGKVEFSMNDFVLNLMDYDVLTPLDAHILDGIAKEECETLPE